MYPLYLCEVLNSDNKIVHTCFRKNGLYTTRDLSWVGINLSNATNDTRLKRGRAKRIHAYVTGIARDALLIQSELIQQSQTSLIKSAYMTKAEAVYKLHASLGHLPYS